MFSSVWAASQFDSDDDMVFEAEDSFDSDTMQLDSDDSFDSDDPIFEDNEFVSNDAALKAEKNTAPWYSNQLIDDSRFTFGYEFSHQLSIKPSYITHDIYLRQETQTLLRDNLYVKFDGRFNYYFDNDHRTKARQKSILTDTNLRELYLQFGFSKFNVTFGRQIVVWGQADTQIITDVVSPRDNSDFIFIKLEDSRLGQLMLSSDIYSDWGHFLFYFSKSSDRQ
ncbi:MAG: hypothetical protein OMM_10754 [Candidatus Magnetoglobus multicellularis str. Araruama]|uniref:Uncharacterized protein n=1 Tax=Candidatus Magnetoglobus multicellularis str. Araruama TaxID=890399 RepID=A0A1V1P054_9BACT|nr:MAG: hypothetical protein OMM_10754 [Candidatus Magnetoglobus multicellularis str. Araruama]